MEEDRWPKRIQIRSQQEISKDGKGRCREKKF
jgi:hypothetical protein